MCIHTISGHLAEFHTKPICQTSTQVKTLKIADTPEVPSVLFQSPLFPQPGVNHSLNFSCQRLASSQFVVSLPPINEIIQYAFICVWLLSPITFVRFIHTAACTCELFNCSCSLAEWYCCCDYTNMDLSTQLRCKWWWNTSTHPPRTAVTESIKSWWGCGRKLTDGL